MDADLSEESLEKSIEMMRSIINEKGDTPIKLTPRPRIFTDGDMELVKKISERENINMLDYLEKMIHPECKIIVSHKWGIILNKLEKESNK
jgi:hypothetical protein